MVSASPRRAVEAADPTRFFANRARVYPKAVHGPARTAKWAVLVVCFALYYGLPWLRWDRGADHPTQALLLDIPHRRFYFFWIELWPQDIYYLTGALIVGAVGLFLVTSLFGRVWCGYTCPQTVWTDLFMWVERRIEGDRNERMRRDQGPLTFDKAWRKIAKHAAWLGVAFWTGGAWIMYYVDAPTLVHEFWTGTASFAVYGFVFLFTATTYMLAGWAREQVCTYMCPWPRFQASMLDEQSLIVTYQRWRGEPRGHGKRDAAGPKLGDCVDCKACIHACPTGIDIRDGVQLECINCGLCVDACNEIMEKVGHPKWLVTWDTLARQSAKAAGQHDALHLLRPRTFIYLTAMLLAVTVMGVALATRPMERISVQHDRAPLFAIVHDGSVRNGYTVKISNETLTATEFELRLSGLAQGGMILAESGAAPAERIVLPVAADSIGTFRILVYGRPGALADGSQRLDFSLRNPRTGEEAVYESVFMAPGGLPAN